MEVSPPHIPIEIIHNILVKSQLKTLMRCQCVCKKWRLLIQDTDSKFCSGQRRAVMISQKPIKRSFTVRSITENLSLVEQFEFRESELGVPNFLSSCNGLVLCSVKEDILLWNPLTRSCEKVFEIRRRKDSKYDVVVNICYDSSTRDYKIVLIVLVRMEDRYGCEFVTVVSLRNKTRRLVPFPYHFLSARDGIEFRNKIHWVVSDEPVSQHENWFGFLECNKIVYFDPECDEFRELPTLEPNRGGKDVIVGLGIIDDCICIAREDKQTRTMEVLVMKKYHIKESWVTKFFFPNVYHYFTFYSPDNSSKVLFWGRNPKTVLIYDLERNEIHNNLLTDSSGGIVGISFYFESFASTTGFIWRDDQSYADNMKWIEDDAGMRSTRTQTRTRRQVRDPNFVYD